MKFGQLGCAVMLLICAACDDAEPVTMGIDAGTTLDQSLLEPVTCSPEGTRQHPVDDPAPIHVPSIAGIDYPSNPPASGPHCPSWGAYRTYPASAPLPRCNWLHNLEHGAVVLLYNCPEACPRLVQALQTIIDQAPADPDCPRKRLILTPDADLDVPVAAAAWGFTWKSTCLDKAARASLAKFVVDHWGSRGISDEARLCAE